MSPYLCPANIPSIGYGSTRYLDGRPVQIDDPDITQDYADNLLNNEVNKLTDKINQLVKIPITANMLSALVSFAYNIGIGNFSKSTLLKKLNAADIHGAADEFLRWNKVKGVECNGLTRRRKAERDLFLT